MKLLVLIFLLIAHKYNAAGERFNIRDVLPWHAAIFVKTEKNVDFCSGALISDKWIITAGHCIIMAEDVGQISIYLNVIDLNELRHPFSVSKAIVHFKYESKNLENDIALLQLATPLVLKPSMQPIALGKDILAKDVAVDTTGWDFISDDIVAGSTSHLNHLQLRTISNTACDNYYGPGTTGLGVVCAIANTQSANRLCKGSGGSPLFLNATCTPILVGIGSFYGSCNNTTPGGFTRVAYYRNWIQKLTGI